MLDHDGDASNQVIWFIGPNPQRDIAAEALQVIDQWLANIRQHPDLTVAQNKPADAIDRCFTSQGDEIARGEHAWDGILDDNPAGDCTKSFPLHSTSRIVAGEPLPGRRLQVPASVGRRRRRPRPLRLLDPVPGRARPPRADLPDRGLRLQPSRRRPTVTSSQHRGNADPGPKGRWFRSAARLPGLLQRSFAGADLRAPCLSARLYGGRLTSKLPEALPGLRSPGSYFTLPGYRESTGTPPGPSEIANGAIPRPPASEAGGDGIDAPSRLRLRARSVRHGRRCSGSRARS